MVLYLLSKTISGMIWYFKSVINTCLFLLKKPTAFSLSSIHTSAKSCVKYLAFFIQNVLIQHTWNILVKLPGLASTFDNLLIIFKGIYIILSS